MSLFKDPNKLPPRIVLNKGTNCACCGLQGIRMLKNGRTGTSWTWAICPKCDRPPGFAAPRPAG